MNTDRARTAAKAVDQAVISVHRGVGPTHGEKIRLELRSLGLASPALLLDVAEFLLGDALTNDVMRLRYRYHDPANLADVQVTWQQAGLVDSDLIAGKMRASGRLREFLESVLNVRVEVAERLWRDRIDSLSLVASGAQAVVAASRGPLAMQFGALPLPHQPALLTHHLLTGLRYHRADAHAAAWQSVGLDRREILALTKAWRGETVEAPSGLMERGWFDQGGVTGAGLEARDEIEVSTNRLAEPAFAAIADHTWPNWLQALEGLAPVTPDQEGIA